VVKTTQHCLKKCTTSPFSGANPANIESPNSDSN
jgi:hypothetical protein